MSFSSPSDSEGIFSFIVNIVTGSSQAHPEPTNWSDPDMCESLAKFIKTVALNEPILENEERDTLYPNANVAHATLTQHHTIRYYNLPSTDQLGLSFLILFFSVNESIAEGQFTPEGRTTKLAVAIGFGASTVPNARAWNLLPTLRDWLEMAHMEILWKHVLHHDMHQVVMKVPGVPNPVPTDWVFTNFNDEWTKKLALLRANVGYWAQSYVDIENFDIKKSHLFRIFDESLQQASRPAVAAPRSALRQSVGKPSKQPEQPPPLTPDHFWERLQLVLSVVLTHHSVILRGKNADDVTAWLHTVGYFLPDDKFLLMRVECNPDHVIIPDLHLQGTTADRPLILMNLHMFRYPPLVVDIDEPLDKERKHVFPKDKLVAFSEKRVHVVLPGYDTVAKGPTGIPIGFGDHCYQCAYNFVKKRTDYQNKAIPVFAIDSFTVVANITKSDLLSQVLGKLRSTIESTISRCQLALQDSRSMQALLKSEVFKESFGQSGADANSINSARTSVDYNAVLSSVNNASITTSNVSMTVMPVSPNPPPAPITSPPTMVGLADTASESPPRRSVDPNNFWPDVISPVPGMSVGWSSSQVEPYLDLFLLSMKTTIQNWRRTVHLRSLQLAIPGTPIQVLRILSSNSTDRKMLHVFADFAARVAAEQEKKICEALAQVPYF